MGTYLIIGSEGNMGRRYSNWLIELGHSVKGIDLQNTLMEWGDIDNHGILVATPTEFHVEHIRILRDLYPEHPILCEKPILKNKLPDDIYRDSRLTMVDQYSYIKTYDFLSDDQITYYFSSYSGKDGLAWDCLNIIGKAQCLDSTLVRVGPEESWMAAINGRAIYLDDMDQAYRDMLEDWCLNPEKTNMDYAKKAHEKVLEYIKRCPESL